MYQRKSLRRKLVQIIQNENVCYCLENRHIGSLTDTWLLVTFKKRLFSFLVISEMVSILASQGKVSNGVAFYWRRKLWNITVRIALQWFQGSSFSSVYINSSVIRQKGLSQNGCFKKIKHAKFSEKRTFTT